MFWLIPKKIKIYEALGLIADNRLEVNHNEAKAYSSSKNKFYTILYNPQDESIMCNDSSSYWQGRLGYPAIAYLMQIGKVKYNEDIIPAFKDFRWKEINKMTRSDYEASERYVLDIIKERGFKTEIIIDEIDTIYKQIKEMRVKINGTKQKPPAE